MLSRAGRATLLHLVKLAEMNCQFGDKHERNRCPDTPGRRLTPEPFRLAQLLLARMYWEYM